MFDILYDGKESTNLFLIGCEQRNDTQLFSEITFMQAWHLKPEMDLYDLENTKRYRVKLPWIFLHQKEQAKTMKVDNVYETKKEPIEIIVDYLKS